MKKLILFFLLSIGISSILGGCSESKLPDTSDIGADLDYYYSQRSCRIESIEVVKETVDKDNQEAYRTCTITATAIDGSFYTTDSWQAFYILHDKGGWELFNTTFVSSDCKLLTDISEDECVKLLHSSLPSGTQIESITSDRENCTAVATYSYSIKEDVFENFGALTTNITGRADFSWDMLNRWTLKNAEELKEYIYNVAFNLQVDPGTSTLNSEKFWLSMDVKVKDNVPSLEVVNYQGSIDTIGNLSISNVQLIQDKNTPESIEITFDYVRDIQNIESDENYSTYYDQLGAYYPAEGSGSIKISNNSSTSIHLYNWVYNGWGGNWKDYIGNATCR